MNIPFIDLKRQYKALKPQTQSRMNTVLEHGQYIMGPPPEVKKLENKLQTNTGARHCITVFSGTEALLISLMALGIKSVMKSLPHHLVLWPRTKAIMP